MSGRTLSRTHSDHLNMLNSIMQNLEYIKRSSNGNREFFIQMAILNLEKAAKDIYDKELSGIARLDEG
jgi:hypothetical protein